MRYLLGLLGLSGLSSASTSSKQYIYNIFTTPSSTSLITRIGPHEASSAIAHRLGLSRFYTLTTEEEERLNAGFSASQFNADLFGTRHPLANIVIEITAANEQASTYFSSSQLPDYEVTGEGEQEGEPRFLETIVESAESDIGEHGSLSLVTEGEGRNGAFYMVPNRPLSPRPNKDSIWTRFLTYVDDPVLSSKFNYENNPRHKAFIQGFVSFADAYHHLQWKAQNENGYIFLQLPLLNFIDPRSDAYPAAVRVLSSITTSKKLQPPNAAKPIIVLSPSTGPPQLYVVSEAEANYDELRRREEIPISMYDTNNLPPPSDPTTFNDVKSSSDEKDNAGDNQKPKPTPLTSRVPRAFRSQEECEKQTSQCSDHGKCVKKDFPVTSWACRCESSTDKSARGTFKKYWAGNACQKEDISVQFHLFFIITLLIVFAIAGAISAMVGMGSQELPGVLTAGIAAGRK